MKRMFRQGDVLVEQIDELPTNMTPKDNILAKGEVTGHNHKIVGRTIVYTDGTQQYMQVKEESVLQHEEHKPIQIPKGNYKVTIQREYDILRDEVRQVLD